jgi:TonB family protein
VTVATTKEVVHAPDPLPVPPPIKAPTIPVLPDRYGDPTSGIAIPSDGSGEGGGAGNGKKGGWGDGDGPGVGPGRDGGRGDGSYAPGGAGRSEPPAAIATRAVILNTPRPVYTEAARANKTEGIVRVRALLRAQGRVTRAAVTRGHTDGLDERALEAVHRIAFRPARDAAGRAVDSGVTVSVSFTIR